MKRKLFLDLILISIYDWIRRPAKPWEFWMPGSGLIGGLLLAVILTSCALLINAGLV